MGRDRRSSTDIHVLVVDDHPGMVDLFCQFLELLGYSADKAWNGKEGLKAFQRVQYDLVITNHDMPEMNGHQLTQEIKKIAPQVPVVMVSAGGMVMDQPPAGVDVYVSKPVTMERLREAVEQAMAGGSRRPPSMHDGPVDR